MKKILLLCMVMGAWMPGAMAQDMGTAKSFIELSGGISNPMGNFASSNYYNNNSGFAQMGTHFAVNGAWYFSPNIGIGGSFSTSSFSLNVNALASGYINDFASDSGGANAKNYNTVNLLIGPYYSVALGRFTVEARVLAGVSNTTSPDIIGTVINHPDASDPASVSSFVQTSASALAFGLDGGLALKYAVCSHFGIVARADWFYSKPQLDFDNIGRQDNLGREISTYNQPISGINATLGVSCFF